MLGSSWGAEVPNYMNVIPADARVMTWLRHGVPIALLADLLDPGGPASREIYRSEAVADDVRLAAAVEASSGLAADDQDFTTNAAGW
jgi:hypothetical protein